ncbi:HEPN domain-containing protein [Azospirillum largimobile]
MSDSDRSATLEESRRWWRVAAEDRRVAQACLAMDPPSLGNAAYHCQQAAEKTMKGLLVAAGIGFRKVHDLDELASVTIPLYPALAVDLDQCRPFTSWATEYRYPPEDESPPPSPRAISEALEVLERLLAATVRLT